MTTKLSKGISCFLLFSVLLSVSSTVYSQSKIGLFAGPQLTTARFKVNDTVQDASSKIGFQAGVNFKFQLEGRLTFAPSIAYNLRGYEVVLKNQTPLPHLDAVTSSTRFHTVELSFLLQHDFSTQPAHWFLRFGPSLDFALFGKEEFTHSANGEVKRDMKFSFGDYGHYMASANLHLGYENPSFFIYGQLNYSLTTMSNNDRGPVILNRALGISIGKWIR